MIWKIFFFFEDYIDTFNQRKIDIEIKWNNAKQITNQNVEKYATYLNDLKINLNINESTSKLKLFKNLNDNFRNFVIFENALTIRYEIFVKILTNEHFFFAKFNKNQFQKNTKNNFRKRKNRNESQFQRNDRRFKKTSIENDQLLNNQQIDVATFQNIKNMIENNELKLY